MSDVCIVGAGLSGLVAARRLVAEERSVVVVEARDRVGGRLCAHDIGDGKSVEVGGQWIGPGQDRLEALAAELAVDTFPTHTEGESILHLCGTTARFEGEFPPLEDKTLADITTALIALEEMAQQVPPEAPWTADSAPEWDRQTFATWIEGNTTDAGAQALLDLVAGAVFTASPDELSLLHVLFYIRSAGGLSPSLTDVTGGAQERRFVGGSTRLAELMAAELGEGVVLDSPVRRVVQSGDRVVVEADSRAFSARRTVVTVPPTVCDLIACDPPLPSDRAQLQRRMAAGSVIKFNVVYPEPFWRSDGLSGRVIDPDGPLTIIFDNSPPDGVPGVLVGFAEADHARALARLAPDQRRTEILECLARSFGPRALEPTDVIAKDWDAEPWTRGCYGANLPPGGWTRYGAALREPVGRVHWAGAETSPIWANYMEGAVRSGERVAAEVLALG